MKILITGAGGFIGRHLCQSLRAQGHELVAVVRRDPGCGFPASSIVTVADIGHPPPDGIFDGCEAVVHLAGRAHILREKAEDAAAQFHADNVQATANWAQAAAKAGIKRFVHLSSIGVLGNRTNGQPYTEATAARPVEDYAQSKWQGEQVLRESAAGTGMDYVVIRPPLVYGADAPGNFARLLKLAAAPIPLPLATVQSKRSLVSIGNLLDFITLCLSHPAAANQVFVVSDGDDVSLPQLLGYLAEGLGKSPRLLPFPPVALKIAARMLGLGASWDKLTTELLVDNGKCRSLLAWQAPYSAAEGLREAGRGFRVHV